MMGHDSISALPTGQIIGNDIYNDVESTLVIEITYLMNQLTNRRIGHGSDRFW